MATAHMQRPYPPIYHPQSSSPSVASPQDQHGRSLYAQPPIHGMYAYPQYPMNSIHSSPYAPHGGPQQQPPPPPPQQQQPQQQQLTSQPLMMSPVSAPIHQQHHQQHQQHPMQPPQHQLGSPRLKLESRPAQQHQQQPPPAGSPTNSGAAPGPIPATTPLVVRQDTNGVQWIAFEYSRDRVKMEYTIRCDVENINIETLSQDFKTENCVYPRACCTKDQYRGNRLVYETECNAVGWALAELNPCLRGKRGLIQRAVDSWRNSHQDPRLRSRRVKRMAKANNRKAVAQHTSHLGASPQSSLPGLPNSSGGAVHHHAGDGSAHADDVSAHDFRPQSQPTTATTTPTTTAYIDASRPSHLFQGAYPYPTAPAPSTVSMPPPRDPSMDHYKSAIAGTNKRPSDDDEPQQFRDLPE
ncbi:hypothetical protein FQN49_008839, partial [Arthroderma sp. PD_2]